MVRVRFAMDASVVKGGFDQGFGFDEAKGRVEGGIEDPRSSG